MADENQTNNGEAAGAQAQQGAQFNIQRIYTKTSLLSLQTRQLFSLKSGSQKLN